MRGRVGGEFTCSVRNTFYNILRTNKTTLTGYSSNVRVYCDNSIVFIIVAGEPTNLAATISSSTNTHVSVTVSWESPADTVTTGYVIYYQSKTGGPVISESVTGGHRESHSLTGLQRGHTYNISIVALSQHLPSPLVGPVNVATGDIRQLFSSHAVVPKLVIETSPQSLYVTSKLVETVAGTLATTEWSTTDIPNIIAGLSTSLTALTHSNKDVYDRVSTGGFSSTTATISYTLFPTSAAETITTLTPTQYYTSSTSGSISYSMYSPSYPSDSILPTSTVRAATTRAMFDTLPTSPSPTNGIVDGNGDS